MKAATSTSLSQEMKRSPLGRKRYGHGYPKDKQSRVFERFYRADESRSQDIKGTGLGLSIVKHIVESHHGRITLESEENKGTCITVQFPVSKEGPREEV